MSDNNGEPFGDDFCEYVHNPLMRQYQAVIRLLQSLRQSQSDCNDIECFNQMNNPNSNSDPFSLQSSTSTMTTTTMLMLWIGFMFLIYLFRPSSMRRSKRSNEANKPATSSSSSNNNRRFDDGDDDNSTVS